MCPFVLCLPVQRAGAKAQTGWLRKLKAPAAELGLQMNQQRELGLGMELCGWGGGMGEIRAERAGEQQLAQQKL